MPSNGLWNEDGRDEREVSVNISIALPDSLYKWLVGYAADRGSNMSECVRALILAHRADVTNARGK